jgi:hypothetical protein
MAHQLNTALVIWAALSLRKQGFAGRLVKACGRQAKKNGQPRNISGQ